MTKFKSAIAIAVGTLFAGAAFAQSNYSIEQRDRAEDARIERGIESGQLTRREASRLEGERAQIERLERRARADGVVTQYERDRISRAQDRLGRDIYRESHDSQVARSHWRTSDRPQGWDRRNEGWGHRNEGWDRRNDAGARFGRSDLAPGRQPHYQQNDLQRTHVQQAQTQRSWTRPAQTSGTGTSTGTSAGAGTAAGTTAPQAQTQRSWTRPAQTSGTATAASSVTAARQGGYSRSTSAASQVTVARQGGYSGRHTR